MLKLIILRAIEAYIHLYSFPVPNNSPIPHAAYLPQGILFAISHFRMGIITWAQGLCCAQPRTTRTLTHQERPRRCGTFLWLIHNKLKCGKIQLRAATREQTGRIKRCCFASVCGHQQPSSPANSTSSLAILSLLLVVVVRFLLAGIPTIAFFSHIVCPRRRNNTHHTTGVMKWWN